MCFIIDNPFYLVFVRYVHILFPSADKKLQTLNKRWSLFPIDNSKIGKLFEFVTRKSIMKYIKNFTEFNENIMKILLLKIFTATEKPIYKLQDYKI